MEPAGVTTALGSREAGLTPEKARSIYAFADYIFIPVAKFMSYTAYHVHVTN